MGQQRRGVKSNAAAGVPLRRSEIKGRGEVSGQSIFGFKSLPVPCAPVRLEILPFPENREKRSRAVNLDSSIRLHRKEIFVPGYHVPRPTLDRGREKLVASGIKSTRVTTFPVTVALIARPLCSVHRAPSRENPRFRLTPTPGVSDTLARSRLGIFTAEAQRALGIEVSDSSRGQARKEAEGHPSRLALLNSGKMRLLALRPRRLCGETGTFGLSAFPARHLVKSDPHLPMASTWFQPAAEVQGPCAERGW